MSHMQPCETIVANGEKGAYDGLLLMQFRTMQCGKSRGRRRRLGMPEGKVSVRVTN
ncbi:hypothetical protein GCM10007919_44920 [Rhizobium indigoferae]|nr:hypothetical protein GCM10007919_44920 [Rhizobium indigoferae]